MSPLRKNYFRNVSNIIYSLIVLLLAINFVTPHKESKISYSYMQENSFNKTRVLQNSEGI